jgi:hypothetical protein
MNIVLISLNLLLILFLSGGLFIDSRIYQVLLKYWGAKNLFRIDIFFLTALFILVGTLLVLLAFFASAKASVLISSLLVLHCAYRSYYTFQRYASPLNRNGIARTQPWFYPCCIIYGLISFSLAMLFNFKWFWIGLIVPLWLFYGYVSAEIEIRYRMKQMNCGRNVAKFSINHDIGRHDFKRLLFGKTDRHPFP